MVILVSTSCYATSLDEGTAWDVVHVLGSAYGTSALNHICNLEWWQSALVMLALGIVWECLDEISYQLKWKNDLFDYHKGFDKGDVFRDCIGISISFPIRRRICK